MKKNSGKELLQKLGTLLALVILIIIFCALMPDKFPKLSNIMNILKQASINCLIAAGMLCALITAGIDLSVVPTACSARAPRRHGPELRHHQPCGLIVVGWP
jgi:ribose transport system permease protein